MNKKLLLGLSAIMLTTTLSGCSQVHFGRDAVTIGTPQKAKPKVEHKKVAKKEKAATSSSKKSEMKTTKKVEKTKSKGKNKKKSKTKSKTKKVVKTDWTVAKTKKLQAAVNNWSKATGQTYRFYDGVHPLKTKKGDTYPQAFTQARFVLKKKPIKIGWSPLSKNKYQYNVVAIANDNFKSWHNTYLFCLKNKKLVILLDQSKKGGVVVVKQVNDATLIKGFKKAYQK